MTLASSVPLSAYDSALFPTMTQHFLLLFLLLLLSLVIVVKVGARGVWGEASYLVIMSVFITFSVTFRIFELWIFLHFGSSRRVVVSTAQDRLIFLLLFTGLSMPHFRLNTSLGFPAQRMFVN